MGCTTPPDASPDALPREPHFETLRKRYDDKRIEEAAHRRAHLGYQKLNIGDTAGSGRVRYLLAQMHQNYYFGYFETVCALAGIILEQALVHRLKRWIREIGPVSYTQGKRQRWIQTAGELLEFNLSDLVSIAREQGVLKGQSSTRLCHQLRWIRNMAVHERIPVFADKSEGRLEMRVVRSRKNPGSHAKIVLDKREVADLAGKRGELTAYFCVTRLREILRSLLLDGTEKKEENDEGWASLFPREEP